MPGVCKKKNQRGQVLLVVVLVMVVALTVGLSVVTRTVTNLRVSREQENSQRAFSAAEAGVERALKNGLSVGNPAPFGDPSTKIISTTVTPLSGSQLLINGASPVVKDDGFDIWLSNYPDYSSPISPQFFSVYFGSLTDNCPDAPALEVIVFSGTISIPSAIQSKRYVYDPCATSRGNGFVFPQGPGSFVTAGKTFPFRTPLSGGQAITITNGLLARIVPLYKNSPIGLYACNNGGNNCSALPTQGKRIDSIGQSGTTLRKVVYYQGYPSLPAELFQYAVFSSK